ncbi:hypothetical protein [Nisaea sp.]|uniref:hypothetical protein n=1 Tax=Nisaea sp. TaxID=2024842 RepID=UPI003297A8D7
MRNLVLDPDFLRLALKAQDNLRKAHRMDDANGLEAQFCVHDMLDMLGAEIDRTKGSAP